ncbi:hypothetical protein BC835DRAFT_1415993 [Cytidiella melzeri]|nr:hypothetical protein BC835DRAFT_1415993 [Cytidiella melzeri]
MPTTVYAGFISHFWTPRDHREGWMTSDNAGNNSTMLLEFARKYHGKFGCVWDPLKRHLGRSEEHDVVGIIRAITIKERLSAKRKELFRTIQFQAGVARLLQLLLNMKVRWSSTYVMLARAHTMKKYADSAQRAFSSKSILSLHLAIPALEALHNAWRLCINRPKYAAFSVALEAGAEKIAKYYDKTKNSDAYIVSILHPNAKGAHFKKYWNAELCTAVKELMEQVVEQRYKDLYSAGLPVKHPYQSSKHLQNLFFELSESKDEEESESQDLSNIQHDLSMSSLWKAEYNTCILSTELPPNGMALVCWWGIFNVSTRLAIPGNSTIGNI